MPHQIDEVRVLRNLGIAAPGPILHHYKWVGQHEPFAHQKDMADFMTLNPRCFNLGDMGTGKTKATLWAFDYRRKLGLSTRAVIVAPLSTLERTWGDEIFSSFHHLSFCVVHGEAKTRLKLLKSDFDIYLINHDGIKTKGVVDAILARSDIDTIILDELAIYRTAGTDRWRFINRLTKAKDTVWGLTGTPTPNSPTDAWAQCKLVNPANVPMSFTSFRDSVMNKTGNYKWVPKPNALQTVERLMQPAIRYSRDECITLPPTTYQTRHVELTPEQDRMYKDMMRKLKAEAESGQLVAVNEAVKANKLVQIACGAGYSRDKEDVLIPAQRRIDEVIDIVEQAGAKVIVFVPIVVALEQVAKALEKHFSVAIIHGQISKHERDSIFSHFSKQKDPRVLVAQPAAMSHGLTLTAANTIVWFAPVNSNEVYQQACARIIRPGQTKNTLIVNLEGTPVERRMYSVLEKKGTMQGVLLDMFQESRK